MGIGLLLQRIRTPQLVVVVERVGYLAGNFPAVLRSDRRERIVIPAVACAGLLIRLWIQTADDFAGGIEIRRQVTEILSRCIPR